MLTIAAMLGFLLAGRIAVPAVVELRTTQEQPASRVATLRALARVPVGERTEPQPDVVFICPAEVPGRAVMLLEPGNRYRVVLEGAGIWAPPFSMEGFPQSGALSLAASGTGEVKARLVNSTGHPLESWPGRVRVRFQLEESPLDVPVSSTFERDCPVTAGEGGQRWLACELPEGVLNLRFEAEGFIPSYRWALRVVPGGSIALGDLPLEIGASIVGTVVRADGTSARAAKLVLEPTVGGAGARAALGTRMEALEFRSESGERGWFQLRGVPPGSYELEVRIPGYGSLQVPRLIVSEPLELRLDEPLVVPWFPAATVSVEPAAARGGTPWKVRLFQSGAQSREASTDASGAALFPLLPAGDYLAMIEGEGDFCTTRPVSLSPENPSVSVDLERVPVVGRITLDGAPLAASLYFGGRHGSESVSMEADRHGEFVGILPREGNWRLEVRSEEPKVRWMSRDVPVEIDSGLGAAELLIELPGTSITGRAIDPDGAPASSAQVILQPEFPEGGVTQTETEADGSFAFVGQGFGGYQIQAVGSGHRQSGVERLQLSGDRPDATVELVLRDQRQVRGRVVSPEGQGIPGARLEAVLADGAMTSNFLIPTASTDAAGNFALDLPSGGSWSGVAILAPGYALAVEPIPPESVGSRWTIPVTQGGGGTLVLTGLAGSAGRAFPRVSLNHLWLLDYGLLASWALLEGTEASPDSLVLPDLPSGSYRICLPGRGAADDCPAGFLSPGGQLTIELEEKRQ